jgi:hypothetical protein
LLTERISRLTWWSWVLASARPKPVMLFII